VPIPSHGVIITAAGSSTRFHTPDDSAGNLKKEFLLIDDRTVLYHAAEPFLFTPGVKGIVVTYPAGRFEETELALDNLVYATSIPVVLVEGGDTRQKSVHIALQHLQDMDLGIDFAAIHDGARPWVTTEVIINTLAVANIIGGAAPVVSIHDALKKIDGEGMIVGHLERSATVAVQTPQIFRFPQILEAHRKAAATSKTYVDDTEIFIDFGGMVGASAGDRRNIKITTPADIPESNRPRSI
jgi:2-C-methyl-D-erythritol 4-phosphate cytidylyltransferase/2-C-methyl-D-erythritol 4-phosphate cytidylyltransferase/2-C-methyl-D-erythritol 2,4-cyclodiphosphate synthase